MATPRTKTLPQDREALERWSAGELVLPENAGAVLRELVEQGHGKRPLSGAARATRDFLGRAPRGFRAALKAEVAAGRAALALVLAWRDLEYHLDVAARERAGPARSALQSLRRLKAAWLAHRRRGRPWHPPTLDRHLETIEKIGRDALLSFEWRALDNAFQAGDFPSVADEIAARIVFRYRFHADLNERTSGKGNTGDPTRDAAAWYLHDAGWTYAQIATIAASAPMPVRELLAGRTAAQLEEDARRHRERVEAAQKKERL